MSKMRLNPATIGVVRSCAMPQAVKHGTSAMNSTSMPWPTSGSLRASSGSSATEPSATVLNRPRSSRCEWPGESSRGIMPHEDRVRHLLDADDDPVLLELELIEPSLYLGLVDGAAERFAAAVLAG